MLKILIAEDDQELRKLFAHVLLGNGYSVREVSNGKEALAAIDEEFFDLIISDIMIPPMDDYELASHLRSAGNNTPMLVIIAKDTFDDMRRAFQSGIDDYMIKPVKVNEMVLRVQALLRRAQMISERKQTLGNTVLEYDTFTVTHNGISTVLPQKEFQVLYKLAYYSGCIFTRQQLMGDVWGYDSESDSHAVDVHIGRLRDRFRDNPDFKIATMRGSGPGLSEEAQKHLIDKFYCEDTAHKAEGNGLGLPLVRRILANTGGTIQAENVPEGGCRFTVKLNAG